MDIFDIGGIRTKFQQPAGTPAKQHCLKRFHECSADARTRVYFRLYGHGLVSPPFAKKLRGHRTSGGCARPIRAVVSRRAKLGSRADAEHIAKNRR